jgi:translocation and assembly module TamB
VLQPIVRESVSKLDGRVDGNLELDLAAGKTRLGGQLVLREGVVQIPAIGQELRKIRARVDLEPGGAVYVRDVSARGLTGRVRASAAARLSGLSFVAARARVWIDDSEKVPLTIEGVSLGNAWGKLELEARASGPRQTTLDVDVSSFHLEMPRLGQRDLQSLDDAERIRIGVQRNRRFVTLPLQPIEEEPEGEPSELVVRVDLGDDVWIRQGAMLRVKLDGDLVVRLARETRIRGQIRISRGRLDVQGKMFEIVHGTITFDGKDPPDPMVSARARWESPDGIVVYADFSGPVSSGKLSLQSVPALTQDQILALLLFGTPDGTFGAGPAGEGGKAAAAVGIGGGVAAQSLNASLGRLTDLDVTTRVDTSGPQPRARLRIGRCSRSTSGWAAAGLWRARSAIAAARCSS